MTPRPSPLWGGPVNAGRSTEAGKVLRHLSVAGGINELFKRSGQEGILNSLAAGQAKRNGIKRLGSESLAILIHHGCHYCLLSGARLDEIRRESRVGKTGRRLRRRTRSGGAVSTGAVVWPQALELSKHPGRPRIGRAGAKVALSGANSGMDRDLHELPVTIDPMNQVERRLAQRLFPVLLAFMVIP